MRFIARLQYRGFILAVLFTFSQSSLAEYVNLDPPFVVNLASDTEIKFAQVSAQVRVAGPDVAKVLETHNPAIRHALVMLLSSKTPQEANTRQGKEDLRNQATETIRKVLEEQHVVFAEEHKEESKDSKDEANKDKKETSSSPIQDVFFTRFIIQ